MIPTMRTIAFITAKGGPGKSTLAASVAVAASQAGETVYVIDMDPQESLYKWGQRRKAHSEEPAVDKTTAEKLQTAVATLKKAGYSLVIIDTAGVDMAANSAAMAVADLCLVPSRPSQLDIEAAKPTVSSLLRMKRKFAFVLNQCPAGRTLRPNDAPTTLPRLVNVGIPTFNIASSIILITAQRLARRLCNCKVPLHVPTETLLNAGFTEAELDGSWTLYGPNPEGCERCKGGGFKGRVGIYQVMPVSEEIQRIIMANGNSMDIAAQAKKEGVKDLRQSGLLKVKQGVTSLDEVLSTTNA